MTIQISHFGPAVYLSLTPVVQMLEKEEEEEEKGEEAAGQGTIWVGRRSAKCPARAGQVLRSRIGGRNRNRRYAHTWPVITYPAGIESWPEGHMPVASRPGKKRKRLCEWEKGGKRREKIRRKWRMSSSE